MQTETSSGKYYWIVSFCIAAMINIAGTFFISEIYLGYQYSATFSALISSIPIIACFSVILSATSILFLLYRCKTISKLLGFMILIIVAWRLLELFLFEDLGLVHFFHWLTPEAAALTPPMSALAAINFFLIGLVMLSWIDNEKISFRIFRLFIAQLIVAIGSIGLLSYALPLDTSFFWEGSPPIHLYIAACQFFLGIAIITTTFYYNTFNKIEITKILPTLVAAILLCFTILLCLGLANSRKVTIESLLNSRGSSNIQKIERDFNRFLDSIKRMSKRIEFSKALPGKAWEEDTESLINSYPKIHRVMWLDTQHIVRKIIPENLNGNYLDLSLPMKLTNRNSFEEAMVNNHTYMIFDLDPSTSKNYIQIFSPVYWDQSLQGVLDSEIDAAEFFQQSLQDGAGEEFTAAITYDDKIIYHSNHIEKDFQDFFWRFNGDISLGNLVFSLWLFPKEQFEGGILNNSFLYLALISGMLISISAGGLFALLGAYKHQYTSLDELQQKLEDTQQKLTTSLQAGGIGTWIWHIKNDQIELDRQGEALFGFDAGTFPGFFASILERTHPQDRHLVEFAMKGLSGIPSERLLHFEFRIILPNNTTRYLEAKGVLFEDYQGRSTNVFGSVWDVTKTKIANIKLELSQEIIRALSDSTTLKEAASKMLRILNTLFETDIIVI